MSLTTAQQTEIAFINGIDSSGKTVATSFQTWNSDTPATYSTDSFASKWGGSLAGTGGGTVTYYFDPASHWTAKEKSAFVAGLDLWSAVANIHFALTSVANTADLTFKRGSDGSAYEQSSDNAQTEPVGSRSLNSQGAGTYISIDTSQYGWQQLGDFNYAGGYAVDTVVHEEGHLLGLGHGGPYDGNDNPKTQQFSVYDNRAWSLMSYIEPEDKTAKFYKDYPLTGTSWNGNDPTTWMPLDILAAQGLYGAAKSTPLSGGQTFGFHCNVKTDIKSFFDFTVNKNPVVTLFDEGRGNTLDLSGFKTPSTIDLRAGTFSSCDGMVNNIAIAYGTAIDNAVGGAGVDHIMGNADNNVIDGGGGNDTLWGYGGHDTFKFDTALNASRNDVTIRDFSAADDLFDLSDAIFKALSPGTLPASDFVIGAAARDASERLIYNSSTGALLYDADGSGRDAAVQFAKLSTGLALHASNFKIFA